MAILVHCPNGHHNLSRIDIRYSYDYRVVGVSPMHTLVRNVTPVALYSVDTKADTVSEQAATDWLVPENELVLSIDRARAQIADNRADLCDVHLFALFG